MTVSCVCCQYLHLLLSCCIPQWLSQYFIVSSPNLSLFTIYFQNLIVNVDYSFRTTAIKSKSSTSILFFHKKKLQTTNDFMNTIILVFIDNSIQICLCLSSHCQQHPHPLQHLHHPHLHHLNPQYWVVPRTNPSSFQWPRDALKPTGRCESRQHHFL